MVSFYNGDTAMPSFDIVSEVDKQEVKNAVDQALRAVQTRYDLKDSKSTIELNEKESTITMCAPDKLTMGALEQILREKLSKRGVSLKSVKFEGALPAGGDTLRQKITVKQGLSEDERKRVSKMIKDMKLKVTAQIQADQVRVTGKQRDDLQTAIAQIRSAITDIELQFINFRD
jgi:uncharacterized protein YajQ (UPF0234 family)